MVSTKKGLIKKRGPLPSSFFSRKWKSVRQSGFIIARLYFLIICSMLWLWWRTPTISGDQGLGLNDNIYLQQSNFNNSDIVKPHKYHTFGIPLPPEKSFTIDDLSFQPSRDEVAYRLKFTLVFPYFEFLDKIHSYNLDSEQYKVDDSHLLVSFVNRQFGDRPQFEQVSCYAFEISFHTLLTSPSSQLQKSKFPGADRLRYRHSDKADKKHYQEVANVSHLDARFYVPGQQNYTSSFTHASLVGLLRAWKEFTHEIKIDEWWISHGTLLSWFWNQGIFPFDTDIDLQTTLYGLKLLWMANGTRFQDDRYLLDVNPHSSKRDFPGNKRYDLNVIDARFIDTHTALFIDITAITKQPRSLPSRRNEVVQYACKSPHWYSYEELFPLRTTMIEGIIVKRPQMPLANMRWEYGEPPLTSRTYKNFEFKENQWIQTHNSSMQMEDGWPWVYPPKESLNEGLREKEEKFERGGRRRRVVNFFSPNK